MDFRFNHNQVLKRDLRFSRSGVFKDSSAQSGMLHHVKLANRYGRIKQSQCLGLQCQNVKEPFLDCLTLQMKALRSFYTSVAIYQSIRRNAPEELNLEI
jgi:hypothetical protein